MAWTMKSKLLESCSCALLCPCVFGPAKPDQEWCSAVFGLQIAEGNADGADLAGARIVMHFQLPGDFVSGIDKAKVYYDPSVSEQQRSSLDAIFHGDKGGLWGGMKEAIGEWLPSSVAPITFGPDDKPGVTVEGVGQVVLQPVTGGEGGPPTILTDAPVLAAFNVQREQMAMAQGTSFSDPDLRAWESLGAGGIAPDLVEWSG